MCAAALPQPISTFVGRADARARLEALLREQPVVLVYGVAGIGKTELCYRAVADSKLALPARLWRAAAGAGLDELIAGLGEADLDRLLAELEARPAVVLIDDAHHVEPAALGRVLAAIARHVTRSRILVTSRVDVALPDDAPPLAMLRLEPLGAAEIAELGARVGELRGAIGPDAAELFRRSAGSPFRALRAIAAPLVPCGDDALAAELATLSPIASHALLTAALGAGRIRPDELNVESVELLALTRRFLLDVERGVAIVHDLVRDALLAARPGAAAAAAHRAVATILLARRAPHATPLDRVAAIHARLAAGDPRDAWHAYQAHVDELVAGGVAHLVLDALHALRAALPDARLDIDLARAQTLLARSRVSEACTVLARAAKVPPGRTSARCLRLLGTAQVRSGRLDRAEDAFRDALARADSPSQKFQIAVEIANVRSLRGDGDEARAILADARRAHPAPSSRERRLARHARTLSWTYQQRFAEAAASAARAKGQGGGGAFALRLLELVGRAESGDIAGARRIAHALRHEAIRNDADDDPRWIAHVGSLRVLEGELRTGRELLEPLLHDLEAGSEHTFALMAGYYLGIAWIGLGAHDRAGRVLARTRARAGETGMVTTATQSQAMGAIAALEAGRLDAARADAEAVRADEGAPAYAKLWAAATLARLAALAGDVVTARGWLDQAAAEAPGRDRAPIVALAELERAEIELLAGDAGRALAHAAAAAHGFGSIERRLLEARARVVSGLALLATGHEVDRMLAARELAEARVIAEPRGYAGVLTRVAVGEASLLLAAGDADGATAHLDGALAAAPTPVTALDTQLVRAARAPHGPASGTVGLDRLIAALGFRGAPRYQLRGRDGRIAAAAEARAPAGEHDLVIDLPRHAIEAPLSGRGVRGFPVACALLAQLVEHDPVGVGPEPLYLGVWHGREYHPLRHRNTVYVGISRLRRALAQVLPGRDVIETTPTGWRLAPGVRAIVIDVART